MPNGRPPKRSGQGVVEPPLDSPSGSSKSKLPRLERPPEDFSSVVKSKLQSYTRTGQACDRCKVRKIRCDQRPDGCTHCTQQNLECYVTDRVTGRTERRGYLQQLEREKNSLLTHIRDLEKLFEDRGLQVRPWQSASAYDPGLSSLASDDDGSQRERWTQYGSVWVKELESAQPGRLGGSAALGQESSQAPMKTSSDQMSAWDTSPLSCINGTTLSILGTTIDVTSFDCPDMDGPPAGTPKAAPLYNKSFQSFCNSTAKVNPPIDAPLPSRDEAFSYSEWFFVMVAAFVPVLHKPTYLRTLVRIYDDRDYTPTASELIIVHMVFAIMYYQFAVRNSDDADRKAQLNELSNKHYHWCLYRIWDIASEVSMTSLQALTLIAIHCRNFPKPGPAYLSATFAWNRAIEMDLHRAYLKKNEPTNLENEMRKRVWWSLFMVVVMLYGRLGRPMPIRTEDIDVEYPILVADEYLTDGGIIENEDMGECYWLVALFCFKLSTLFMDMWNNVYSVRHDTKRYVESVRRVEQKFHAFQREIPEDLRPEKCKDTNKVVARYLQCSSYELLFCLRHPSRCCSDDPSLVAENCRLTDEAARNMLRAGDELAKLKSLDATWYQLAVFVGVVFTMLASKWERRTEITSGELSELKDMVTWGMTIIREILTYSGGAESSIMGEITSIVNRTIAGIEQDMVSQRSSRTSTPTAYPQHTQQLVSRLSDNTDEYGGTSRRGHTLKSASSAAVAIHEGPADQTMAVSHLGGISQQQQQQQHQHQHHHQQQPHQSSSQFYNSPLSSINSAYSQMGYPELGGAHSTGSTGTPYLSGGDDGGASQHAYLYAASAAAGVPTSQMTGHHQHHHQHPHGAQRPGTSPQAGQDTTTSQQHHQPQHHQQAPQQQQPQQQQHSMGGYASQSDASQASQQPHPHHHHQQQQQQHSSHAPWLSSGVPAPAGHANPWSEWPGAMVDPATQDRYSANALLTLGAGQRGPGDAGATMGPGMPTGHSGQWPMLVFHPPNASGP